jgi:hypothetical protein
MVFFINQFPSQLTLKKSIGGNGGGCFIRVQFYA